MISFLFSVVTWERGRYGMREQEVGQAGKEGGQGNVVKSNRGRELVTRLEGSSEMGVGRFWGGLP